jgi:imidazole glycerol phosphate synthase glutamine amidotransferase subunit
MRKANLRRTTTETDIRVSLNLDGQGRAKISTGIPFLDHMLTLVARHGAMDLELSARGDLEVDQHHTVEDTGIVLGEAVRKALGSKRGILRAGYFLMPMDETLAAAAIDFSGRPHLVCKWKFSAKRVGGLQTELLEDFFGGFAQAAGANVHLRLLYGVRQGAALCCHARSAIEARAAQHERSAMNIALVEYGAGNLPSVERALSKLGVESRRASAPEALADCDALILPGVGHFGALMRSLGERSLVKPLREAVSRGTPLLGICLGLQAMFAASDEAPGDAGLALFPQRVSALPPADRLPHMGWNQLRRARPSKLLEGVPEDAYFYFAHSYAALDAGEAGVAFCDHCAPFVAVLEHGNVFATQFHPEKSGPVGARILSNFVRQAGNKG